MSMRRLHAIRQRHRITQSKVGSRLPPSRQPGARQRVSGRVSSSWCPDAYLKPALWGSTEHFRHWDAAKEPVLYLGVLRSVP